MANKSRLEISRHSYWWTDRENLKCGETMKSEGIKYVLGILGIDIGRELSELFMNKILPSTYKIVGQLEIVHNVVRLDHSIVASLTLELVEHDKF